MTHGQPGGLPMKHLPGPCRLPDPLGCPLSLGCPWAAVPPGVPKEALDLPHRMCPELELDTPPGGGPEGGPWCPPRAKWWPGGADEQAVFRGFQPHSRNSRWSDS